uniref:Transposon protein, putative, CACTA, En/Spm sub-class n=1 Tax=Oryza sativa subsp. japonica TaxID=39947 RepID=Q109T3_ORYSJ|nr:transposon protein, putative, CACTA, En/Spm sub-class [Oryza sativa Japonica Group]
MWDKSVQDGQRSLGRRGGRPRFIGGCKEKNSGYGDVVYLPVKDRLKQLFSNRNDAELMRWHQEGRKTDGMIQHPADARQWKNIDALHSEFAKDLRNIRFALSTDRMNPFGDLSSKHSTWLVLLTMYNLPTWICQKRKYILLSILIQGPKQSGIDIDVFLEPLMEDMQEMWKEGLRVWNKYCREHFTLRAIIFVTINDLPVNFSLSVFDTTKKIKVVSRKVKKKAGKRKKAKDQDNTNATDQENTLPFKKHSLFFRYMSSLWSAYQLLTQHGSLWKPADYIWIKAIPNKCRIFLWLASETKGNMVRKNWDDDTHCYICPSIENADHIILRCKAATRLWEKLGLQDLANSSESTQVFLETIWDSYTNIQGIQPIWFAAWWHRSDAMTSMFSWGLTSHKSNIPTKIPRSSVDGRTTAQHPPTARGENVLEGSKTPLEWKLPEKALAGMEMPCDQNDKLLFTAVSKIMIGNGGTIRFWDNVWLDGRWLKDVAPLVYSISRRKNCTSDRLVTRGWQNNSVCPLCWHTDETAIYLLVECRYTKKIWDAIASWIAYAPMAPTDWTQATTVHEWWEYLAACHGVPKLGTISLILIMSWEIWNEQNRRIFRNKELSTAALITKIKEESKTGATAGAKYLAEMLP